MYPFTPVALYTKIRMLIVTLILFSTQTTIALRSGSTNRHHDLALTHRAEAALPAGWSPSGCFTDISTSRSLRAKSFTNVNNMTIESCISFCAASDYVLAGLEFGWECYCDSAVQVPGALAEASDCNVPCKGDPSTVCGGGNRLSVFVSNKPAPVIVRSVDNGNWVYQGCFTDTPLSRTLPTGFNIPTGVTAESCTATCQTAGFKLAGLEDGRECWCANSISSSQTQHVSDNDCRFVCTSNHNEFCGNQNRLAVYTSISGGGSGPGSGTCLETNLNNFTLTATYQVPPETGPATIPLKVVLVEMIPSVTWGILSGCPLCCSDYPTFSMQNSVFMPHSLSNPLQVMVSGSPGDGESPTFVASNPAFPGFQSYCIMPPTDDTPSMASNAIGVLAFGGTSDAFSLCKNTTVGAGERLDVVFTPVTGHPHYDLANCSPVVIEVVV